MSPDSFLKYQTYLFDCDGVLVDSNDIKAHCFYKTVLPYGEEIAVKFLTYCRSNWGMSRFHFFNYFVSTLLGVTDKNLEEKLIKNYAGFVEDALRACQVTEGTLNLLQLLISKGKKSHVVSGGLESEVINLLNEKGLAQYFESINGSPRTKEFILEQLHLDPKKCLFIGDSNKDQKAAKSAGIDFLFVSEYSDITSDLLTAPFFEVETLSRLLP